MKVVFKKMVLAGAIAAVVSAPAMAAVSASASISDLTITLYDLNPLDGIAPTITWATISGDPNMATYTSASVSSKYGNGSNSNYMPIGEVNSSTATIFNAAAASNITATSVSASGSATATSVGWPGKSFNALAENYNYWGGGNFILSANTVAVFQANASTQATATVGYDFIHGEGEYASASASLTLSGVGASGHGTQATNDNISSDAGYYYGSYPNGTTSSSATLAGAFVNSSTGTLTGTFQLRANVDGRTSVVDIPSTIAAVPEPESYAMFLAGLGLIGAVARRRQAR